ncbi:phosphate acetyltransferase [Neomicrococcus aestuarii]|uniref:Phosphate acetyltransferase n=1 Tax=Neomicrococcus aestuarii TaxID=556325 RepID=A0A1L2ZNZ6_9MICC|nr:phosphate acetyltransferase [Neomicrococcus aestuarii]APF40886.1 phosphate acetyltransferase [Neomicrococcus aestuarii]
MARGIYISATTSSSGKSLISLGLADVLHRHADKIGFFRPITETANLDEDPIVRMVASAFELPATRARAGMTRTESRELIVSGQTDEIYSRSLEVFESIAEECDVVIVEGTDLTGHDFAVEFDLNARLANHLGCHVVGVVNAHGLTVDEAVDAIDVARSSFYDEKVSLLSMIVNRANVSEAAALQEKARPGLHNRKVYVIPEIEEIVNPTVGEIASTLDAQLIAGAPLLDREVKHVLVAAMNVGYFLERLRDEAFIITPADRSDILTTAIATSRTPSFPATSGILLTGPRPVEDSVLPLLAEAPFPVFTSVEDTYTSAHKVWDVRGDLSSGQPRKVAAALGQWYKSIDEAELLERMHLPAPTTMTPLRFLHGLIERARKAQQRIVLPEGEDVRILEAAEIIHRRGICELVILGDLKQVRELSNQHGFDLSGIEIIDPSKSEHLENFAQEYARLRAHKGVSIEQARERMLERSYFGTMMVHLGLANGMVSGAAHTTANTIRPSLEFIKTRPGVKIVSSVFLMLLEDRVLVYGDCAVNPEPNAEQLADIAVASAATARQFGVEPRVAMLSYSTGASGSGGAVDDVRAATELVRDLAPDLAVDGPIQYDAAVDASIGASKLPGSSVAGQATVFVFPDLNTGNNTYKAVQQSAGAVAVGPILQGLNKAVNDLSRGCTVEDIVNTVAITAIQAQES